jgi:hypothetical protein
MRLAFLVRDLALPSGYENRDEKDTHETGLAQSRAKAGTGSSQKHDANHIMNSVISPKQLLGQLNWRYAVKQFDSTRKISPEVWTALEDALVLTPSSGGLQPWAFIVVDDPAIREKLVPASYGQTKVKEASHLVVFAAKQNFSEADVDAHIKRTAEVQGQT